MFIPVLHSVIPGSDSALIRNTTQADGQVSSFFYIIISHSIFFSNRQQWSITVFNNREKVVLFFLSLPKLGSMFVCRGLYVYECWSMCLCRPMYVFSIVATPFSLQLCNFGITFLMWLSKYRFFSNFGTVWLQSKIHSPTSYNVC